MLLAIFGSPSALTYATNLIIQKMAHAVFGGYTFMQANLLTELKAQWASLNSPQLRCVIFFSDCPHSEVSQLMARTKAPIVLVNENYRSVFLYVMITREMEFPFVARFTTQVSCALQELSHAENILRIGSADMRTRMPTFVGRLMQHYGLTCSPDNFSALIASLQGPDGQQAETLGDFVCAHFPRVREMERAWENLNARDRDVLLHLERDYGQLTAGGALNRVEWPTSLFMKWDAPISFLENAIDLQGPARFIICGPYLHLPAGAWRLTAHIDVETCFSDNRIGADIFCERVLAAVTAKLPPAGQFEFHLDFVISNSLAPVEMRLQLLTGAIEGRIFLDSVRLDCLAQS